ncbi:2-dehydro-3-deoxygalactonokinase [Pelagibacterium luteolum]|uniref:2-dehydro-3-deoxygalactonokinase n=1 Tax=Pelagibacterium luteolum TaxID=440168 RepID=A0A1G7XRP6_9HYPH|nr:2-dehydro-3-deoxygalactonokinase [Pelagibacterium luteolum]SDG86838.1 2-dehydro-3-deoxygalactonokinase [Pelagibacterium luteolum]
MTPDWIGVDWGTSNMRAWAMSADNRALAHAASDKGMGSLSPDAFEDALIAVISPWLSDGTTTQIIACGMVGARQGWMEAHYSPTPTVPIAASMITPPTRDTRIAVHIVPGVCQASPADVMRGEETQIAGFIAHSSRDGIVCLPGTHSKWVEIVDGRIVSFYTDMTGELFSLLSTHSVLRHSVTTDGWADGAFAQGVSDGFAAANPLPYLFGLRASSLLTGLSPETAKARLSGLLIGGELASRQELWADTKVSLIGAPRLSGLYAQALAIVGGNAEVLDADMMTLAGLAAARAVLEDRI